MTTYISFFRGINSGSNPTLKMETLRKICEDLGFKNVRTVLASGNVIFENDQLERRTIENILEMELIKRLRYKVLAIVQSSTDIENLINSNPFEGVEIKPQIRLYISYFKDAPANDLKFPYHDINQVFTILGSENGIVRSVVDLDKGITPDLMSFLDKKFGKSNTTRNWNTIERINSIFH